jgi:hypothetical protein
MQNTFEDFPIEYQYTPSPDAEERLAQAWDMILALILEDFENEQKPLRRVSND